MIYSPEHCWPASRHTHAFKPPPQDKTMKYSMMLVLLLALAGCSGSKTPETADTPDGAQPPGAAQVVTPEEPVYDDKEMEAAVARAKSEVDTFIAELASPTGTEHEIKAPVEDKGEIEHLWISNVTFENGEFKGKINSQPEFVQNVKAGQDWTVKKEDISDWMFMRDGKMHGNYTTRALITTMTPEEAAEFKSTLADP
jgi:uncharacterized protein YegJ (DUF2314 family)